MKRKNNNKWQQVRIQEDQGLLDVKNSIGKNRIVNFQAFVFEGSFL